MKNGEIAIHDLDFDYKLWKLKIRFYQDELSIFKNRIESIKKEHPDYITINKQYNLLDDQRDFLNRVLNQITIREQEMALFAEDYPINQKHIHVMEHEHLRNDMVKAEHYQNFIHDEIYPGLCYPLKAQYD